MSRFRELANAGVLLCQDTDLFIQYRLASEDLRAVVGLCYEQMAAFADLGRHIVSIEYSGGPFNRRDRVPAEIIARLRHGIDGDATGLSLASLSAEYLMTEPFDHALARTYLDLARQVEGSAAS